MTAPTSLHTPNAQVRESFEEMQGLHADRLPRLEKKTWGELAWGMYLNDANGKTWQVIGVAQGWVRLLDMDGREVSVPPRRPDHPVDVIVLPMADAVLLVEKCLGGIVVSDNFSVARQMLVADRWRVDMMPTTGGKSALVKLRDHMDWFHASQWTGDIKTIEALAVAHEEMHQSIADTPMSKAHHHAPNPGGQR